MQEFSKNGKRTLHYRILVFSLLCAALFALPLTAIIMTGGTNAFAPLIYIMSALLMLVSFIFTVIYAIVGHKILAFSYGEDGLYIIKGFIFKKHIFLPTGKIKGIKIISKKTIYKDLCTIVILNDSSDVAIRDIDIKLAKELTQKIMPGAIADETL